MVLLVEKLGRSLKFPSKMEDHPPKSDGSSASLRDFHSKISNFITQMLLKPEPGSEFMSLAWFETCFQLIHVTKRAFVKLVMEIDHPMSLWGFCITEEYLNYSLNLLDMLNSISSSVCHLNLARISILHSLSSIKSSTSFLTHEHMKIIPGKKLGKDFKVSNSVGIEEKPGSEKDRAVLEAIFVMKKIGFLALGMVLSGLCGGAKPYTAIRKSTEGFESKNSCLSALIKSLDSRFYSKAVEEKGIMVEVERVNCAIERLSGATSRGSYAKDVEELKRGLEVLENSLRGIEKQANSMFSELLVARNKLVDKIRLGSPHRILD